MELAPSGASPERAGAPEEPVDTIRSEREWHMAAHPGTSSSSSSPVVPAPAILARATHATHGRMPRGLLRLCVLLPLALASLLAACGGSSGPGAGGNGNTLVFGAPVSLTGSLSHEGTDTLNG